MVKVVEKTQQPMTAEVLKQRWEAYVRRFAKSLSKSSCDAFRACCTKQQIEPRMLFEGVNTLSVDSFLKKCREYNLDDANVINEVASAVATNKALDFHVFLTTLLQHTEFPYDDIARSAAYINLEELAPENDPTGTNVAAFSLFLSTLGFASIALR